MSKAVAVSFEGINVKVVHASLKRGTLSVGSVETIPENEFDFFLHKEKSTEFIVTCEFREAFHDIISIPVTKQRFLEKIVESEIRKATGKRDFTFVYSLLGETVSDNQKISNVFYYSVSNEEIREVVDRFHSRGKIVRAIYPPVFSAAALVESVSPGEANMGVFGSERDRTVFFSKDGNISFIRNYESIGPEFDSFDIQNINMTINYCFQTLRVNPSSVLLMGNLIELPDISNLPTAPLASLCKTDNVECDVGMFNEYILPISSLFTPGESNILSRDFKSINTIRRAMSVASIAFIVTAIVCASFSAIVVKDISAKQDLIVQARKNISDIDDIYSAYEEIEEDVERSRDAVKFLNREAPDIAGLLVGIGSIDIGNLRFETLEVEAREREPVALSIRGMSSDSSFLAMEHSLRSLVNSLKDINGVKVKESKQNLKEKTFLVVLEYRE